MWHIMYILQDGSGRTRLEFIPLNFKEIIGISSIETTNREDINNLAALVWYGFLRGRFGKDQEFGIARDPELVWREPINISVLEPIKPQEDVPA